MKAVTYHYVRPDTLGLPHFRYLHIDDFRQQLDRFVANDDLVEREVFFRALESGVAPARGCVLTFDDGFKDHFEFVLPALEARGLWGIFYVPTGMYASGELLDVHRIHLLLGSRGGKAIAEALDRVLDDQMLSDKHREQFRSRTYRSRSNDEYTLSVKRCLNYFVAYEYRKRVLDVLMDEFFGNARQLVDDFYMNQEELTAIQRAGMILGSHTVTHPVMSRLSVREQETEISESFAFLARVTGGLTVRTFCYPYGGFHTFTEATEQILSDAGCKFSFNVEARDITNADLQTRPQALPRYDCNIFPNGACRG